MIFGTRADKIKVITLMKRKLLIIFTLVLFGVMCAVAYTQSGKSANEDGDSVNSKQVKREERHRQREERRAQRLAEYERYIDSLVLSRQFQFVPQDIEQQPAGSVRQLNNPNFQLAVWGSEVDVCLPYIKGVTPPYYYVILNYTLPSVSHYLTEQTHEGWVVSFDSSLYSVTDYHFSLNIYPSSGSATLTISTAWYPDVSYDGSIISLN